MSSIGPPSTTLSYLSGMDLVLFVVPIDEVPKYSVRFPEDEVVVPVVDERRDLGVGVVLCVLWELMFTCLERQIASRVGEAKFFEDYRAFPVMKTTVEATRVDHDDDTHHPFGAHLCENSVNCGAGDMGRAVEVKGFERE